MTRKTNITTLRPPSPLEGKPPFYGGPSLNVRITYVDEKKAKNEKVLRDVGRK